MIRGVLGVTNQMRGRRALVAVMLALFGAAVLTWATTPMSATERIVRIEAARAQSQLADDLERWSVDVNAALHHYAGDEQLTLAAQLALASYPEAAEKVLGLYGTTPDFKRILRRYGAAVVPPIQYFLANESQMLQLRHRATAAFAAGDAGSAAPAAEAEPDADRLTAAERGWYAVGFIESDGHDFLGQFVSDRDGEVSWVQTERLATGAKRFLTSGLTSLEAKWHREDAIGAGDYAWAAVDVAVPIAAFRVAKAARTGRIARVGVRNMRVAKPMGAAATLATAGYLITHPSLVGDIARGVAEALSLPGWLVELALWFVLLLPVIIIARVLQRWLIRPVRRLLLTTIALLRWLHQRLAPPPAA